MPVPPEILAVPRPVNTIVQVYGKNNDHYAVRKRKGCTYDNGRRVPRNGETIGHIIDLQFVPVDKTEPILLSQDGPDIKDWANVVLCDELFKPIMQELEAVYNKKDAVKIYCISLLQVCFKGVTHEELQEAYETSFVSVLYPDVPLSSNTVCTFVKDLGKNCRRIRQFMQNRTAAVKADARLLIDGTLKSNKSKINSLSNFSRKAKVKGSPDISILYAFDLEKMEPVCSECFPGNMLDATAYQNFIRTNHIKNGILIGDKGFPESCADTEFKKNPNLHFLNPLKRNSKYIKSYDLLNYEAILPGHEGIMYKKIKVKEEDRWIYCFRDEYLAHEEERSYLKNRKKKGDFSNEKLEMKRPKFGTIILESDLDLHPELIYKMYDCRWEIELVMRYYKHALDFDTTRVHNDYSVYGSEFLNFLSALLTFKLINKFDEGNLLEQYTYKNLMGILKSAKKALSDDGSEWKFVKINPSKFQVLITLGLVPKPVPVKPKRGRPKGSKNKPKCSVQE